MVTRKPMVCESLGKETNCVRGDILPLVHLTYSKLHHRLIINLRHVFLCWSHLRFNVDLPSWESPYLIGLNPNYFKAWFLAIHLFFYFVYLIPGGILYNVILNSQILKSTTKSS